MTTTCQTQDAKASCIGLLDTIGKNVRLVQCGDSLYLGRSPLSAEADAASLLVSSDLQRFHCRATGQSGGLAKWIEAIETLRSQETERRAS